jgi:uncharacterized membrane protein
MPDQADELRNLRTLLESLSAEVSELRLRIDALEHARPPAHPVQPLAPPQIETPPQALETRLGLTIINRIGAITLAIGIVFFFKYAVDNRWIGQSGRVTLGVLGGLILIAAAEWLKQRDQRVFSQGIGGCGLAVLYISLYASFAYYQLVPQSGAFLGMVATCGLAAFLSFRYQSAAISVLGLIGAFLTPLLLSTGQERRWLFLLYLLALDIAALAISARRRWVVLDVLAFAGTAVLFLLWAGEPGEKTAIGLFFLVLYFALFFVVSLRTIAFVPFVAFWAILSAWELLKIQYSNWIAPFAFLLAIVYFAAAHMARSAERIRTPFSVVAHACLLTAAARELLVWTSDNIAYASRASFLSEATSVFLTIYAILMIARGIIARALVDRVIGLVLIAVVVVKLYFYDVWLLTRFYRISVFVALGVLLLAASYLYSRFKDKLNVLLTGKGEEG